jgi:hypothetical protein
MVGSNVGGVLRNKGYSSLQLMLMFYLVCVVLRLGMAYGVWLYGDRVSVLIGLLIVGLIAIILNVRGIMSGKKVWWSRQFHLLITIAVIVTSILSLYYSKDNGIRKLFREILTGLLLVDVSVGVITSIFVKPF